MYEHNAVLLTVVGVVALMISAIAMAFLPKRITAKYPGGVPRNMQRLRSAAPYLGFILWCAAMVILAAKFEIFYSLAFIWFGPELLGFIRALVSDAKDG